MLGRIRARARDRILRLLAPITRLPPISATPAPIPSLSTCQAHSAITVTFTDVTKGEAAKALVRRRIETPCDPDPVPDPDLGPDPDPGPDQVRRLIEISYHSPESDEVVMGLLDPEKFSFNPAGTDRTLQPNPNPNPQP